MAYATTYVDVEGPVRDWTRSVVPAVDGRAFFGLPTGVAYPCIVVQMVNAPPDRHLPSVDAMFQFDVLAARLDEGGSKLQATTPRIQLVNAAEALVPGTNLGPGVDALGANVVADRWRPDPDTGAPRYVVDVRFDLLMTTT